MIDPGLWRICRWHDLEDTRYTWQRPLSYSRNAWQLCERRCYFSRGGTLSRGQVIERKHDAYGNTFGWANDNPNLDSRHFLVEFEDGEVTELTANVISEYIYDMCDLEGECILQFGCVVYFKRDRNAMTLSDNKFLDSCGKAQHYSSTKGWQLCCQRKDGSMSWENIRDLIFFPCRLLGMLLHKALHTNQYLTGEWDIL